MIHLDQALPADPPRDRWGRYLVRLPGEKKAKGRTRVTTFLKALDQGDGLIAWKATATMVGALRNPGLMAKWAAIYAQSTDPWYASDTLKTACKKLVDECADHGGAQSRASLGTALHTMVELVARGETPELVSPYREDVEAWQSTLAAAGLVADRRWTEVCVYIEKYDLVGTFDGLYFRTTREWDLPTHILGDLKTETSTDYKALNHAAQLAAYSLATHRIIFPVNPDDECVLEPLPDFDRDTGLIIHLPAGEAACHLHAVDLAQGREALEVAATMRRLDAQRKRKDTGGLMRPWTTLAPVAVQLAGDGGDVGAEGPSPSAPATNLEETWTRTTKTSPSGASTASPHGPDRTDASPTVTGSVNPPTTTGGTTTPTTDPQADPADVLFAQGKFAALDLAQKQRIVGWLKEGDFGMSGGRTTTRRLALVEASIAIAQEAWTDDDYRSLIAVTGHASDSFTAPIGALLARLDHTQAQQLFTNIQHAARTKENQTNAL